MLHLRSIAKSYESGDVKQTVLDGINLSLEAPSLVCVLGKSGCGKTTLLNIIGGLDREFEGDLEMQGASFADFSELAWDRYRANLVGFVFQDAHLIDYLTVFDNVRIALAFGDEAQKGAQSAALKAGRVRLGGKGASSESGAAASDDAHAPSGHGAAALDGKGASSESAAVPFDDERERVLSALRQCGIEELSDRMPNELSGGQAQRVAIARAIVKEPQIVLADEPTGSLDSANGRQVMDLLARIAQTRLVVMVTHDRDIAYRYAFTTNTIYKLEIAAQTNMYFLLERFVGAAIIYDTDQKMTSVQERLMSLISDNYKAIYRTYSKDKSEREQLYLRLLLVTDSICGMTDSYAKRLYQELSGIIG